MVHEFDPNVTPSYSNPTPDNPNPGSSTPVTNSQSWQEQARAAGWQAPEENSGFQQSSPQTQQMQTTPVDIGAGSSPMSGVALTPETGVGQKPADFPWDTTQVNKDNGLPDEISLSDVFSRIKLHPTEIASLLAQWAGMHHGGPNQNLSNKLNTEAAKVASPNTYKSNAESDR